MDTNNLFTRTLNNSQRLTQKRKDANHKQWYKDQADLIDNHANTSGSTLATFNSENFSGKKLNYDLFNNSINMKDFLYICKPFGAKGGELPARFTNRDIVSGKIKVLLGIEMKMPFSWRIIATNEEATTRKEQEEFGRIREFVINEVMQPIRMKTEQDAAAQSKGKELTPEEKDQIKQHVEKEIQTQTPDEVRRYMQREHQDPAEVMHQQLLEYLILKEKMNDKFNKGWKHMNLGGGEFYHVGIFRGEPGVRVVNTLNFEYDQSPDLDDVSDGEWARAEYRMSPSQVVADFGDELTEDEIDRIYERNNSPASADFTFTEGANSHTLSVRHLVWKSLMKIGFLTYIDRGGKEQLSLVDENYRLNEDAGDIDIQWEWIPETHECWKVLDDIYVHAGPVAGQYRDLDNLYHCKLPYYGTSCDNLNSACVAPMDRMKGYQYIYNVIIYRIELLMASDKGKILAANIKALPKSSGIDSTQFSYFMEANKIAWLNPNEEGNRGNGGDIVNMVKEIDMSLTSQISQYIQFAEYIKRECGNSIGVTAQMEAQIAPNEAVNNTKQNLIQSSYIIQPYFELHNTIKGSVLQALIECAKVAYSQSKPRKLSYVLDDMSVRTLSLDIGLLEGTTVGLFLSNSSKAEDAKRAIIALGEAAMQNQQTTLKDMIKIIKSNNVQEAEELLEVSEDKRMQQEQANEQAKIAAQERLESKQSAWKEKEWEHEAQMIVLKAKEEGRIKVQIEAMAAMGFDPNKDEDNDGTPDVLEVARFGVDTDIKRKQLEQGDRKLDLEEDKLDHQKKNDAQKLIIDRKKANKPTSKS